MVYERKVLRRIFGPTKEGDGTWRIKTNDKFNRLIKYKNIINHTRAQRLSWFGHLHRVNTTSTTLMVMSSKIKQKRGLRENVVVQGYPMLKLPRLGLGDH
jgi:hypothetical protein